MEQADIEEIRRIPLTEFLARLGHRPVSRSGDELWYRAPYRSERTPSFRVNVEKGLWYDFGLGRGGDIFTLAGEFIHGGDFTAQARFIADAANLPLDKSVVQTFKPRPQESIFENVQASPLRYAALTGYLSERGIPHNVALRHCCQLNYTLHQKACFAVGFPNTAGGYELRNRFFKGCIPPKEVSLIRKEETASDGCNVFEGFMDFLSAVVLRITDEEDSLVLNSVANIARSYRYLDDYKRIACFLDRDEAGRRTLEVLRTRYGGKVTDRSALYQGCKDLNEYLQQSMKQQENNKLKIKL